jgi:hypothetical protein
LKTYLRKLRDLEKEITIFSSDQGWNNSDWW